MGNLFRLNVCNFKMMLILQILFYLCQYCLIKFLAKIEASNMCLRF